MGFEVLHKSTCGSAEHLTNGQYSSKQAVLLSLKLKSLNP